MASDPVNTPCFTRTPWLWLPRILDKFLLKLQAKASSEQLARLGSQDTWPEIDQSQSYSYPQLLFCYHWTSLTQAETCRSCLGIREQGYRRLKGQKGWKGKSYFGSHTSCHTHQKEEFSRDHSIYCAKYRKILMYIYFVLIKKLFSKAAFQIHPIRYHKH